MKIEIKHRFTDDVIYSHECENNIVKRTLMKACRANVDLRDANLSHADLHYSDLSLIDLRGADLNGSNLRGSNIYSADMRGADLRCADLRGTMLHDVDLRGANLQNTIGNGRQIKTIQTNRWTIVMTKKVMAIGCEQHTYKKWMKFTDEQISEMDDEALEFWKNWKNIIKKMHKLGFE